MNERNPIKLTGPAADDDNEFKENQLILIHMFAHKRKCHQ